MDWSHWFHWFWEHCQQVDWQLVSRIAGLVILVVGSVAGVLYKLRNSREKSRDSLKIDMEILKMLDRSHSTYYALEASVNDRLGRIYQADRSRSLIGNVVTLFIGIFIVSGLGYWTYYLIRDGFTWWSLLPGYGAFIGVAVVLGAFTDFFGSTASQPELVQKLEGVGEVRKGTEKVANIKYRIHVLKNPNSRIFTRGAVSVGGDKDILASGCTEREVYDSRETFKVIKEVLQDVMTRLGKSPKDYYSFPTLIMEDGQELDFAVTRPSYPLKGTPLIQGMGDIRVPKDQEKKPEAQTPS